ncbi:DUF4145 domain-containing protein [Isoptericola sp. NPDC056605]|uniref:DUF4145 domain-containing protein n=1 Tax=Isoptericola sp. NPDC056605 TaxID=3345876 RepID=UPI0036A0D7B6
MAETTCGWCRRAVHMTPHGTAITRGQYHDRYVTDAAFTCDNCHRISVATWWSTDDPGRYRDTVEPQSFDHPVWNPPPGAYREFPDVPEPIGSAATEAWYCHAAGSERAALAVARAVVEASAKKFGKTTGTLMAKIDALAEDGEIREDTRESAHAIRLVGNDVAHGDDVAAAITSEEAEEVLVLMDDLLTELFESRAKRERAKAAREVRLAAESAKRAASDTGN